ncbi:MAG TPA: aminotransferase class V-fold PLP-dependent enzyme [Nonomuraea sp.]|nr:aminotransferase class V-fold PLP-dependent enzyme [Nonomuraea sp.]
MTALAHFNNAGAGLMPPSVVDAVTGFLRREAADGAYEAEQRFLDVFELGVYQRLADALGAHPSDVALFDSATRAWCAVVCQLEFRPGDRVWLTPYEYAGNVISLIEVSRRHGCALEVIPTRPDGDLDLDWMAAHLDDDVAMVCVTHVPSGCGLVNPVAAIGALLAGHRCVYAVDACQSVGQLPVDVTAWGCDLLTGAGRKFLRGPRGTGFACVSPALRERVRPPFHDLHVSRVTGLTSYEVSAAGARTLELAECSKAAVLGLDAALRHHAGADLAAGAALYRRLTAELAGVPGIRLIMPGTEHAGIVSLTHDRVPVRRIHDELSRRRVNTWVIQGEHTPVYMAERGVRTALRVSSHYYNTEEEVDRLVSALREICGRP